MTESDEREAIIAKLRFILEATRRIHKAESEIWDEVHNLFYLLAETSDD